MNLILSYGYPFPYPDGLTEAQQEELSLAAPSYRLVIVGVSHFEQKHTTTVEFANEDAFNTARDITGWQRWSEGVLEAPTSAADGYDYPAIVVGNVAYCGHQLVEHKSPAAPDKLADALRLLRANLSAWEDEEDSVKEEHADLIAELDTFLASAG